MDKIIGYQMACACWTWLAIRLKHAKAAYTITFLLMVHVFNVHFFLIATVVTNSIHNHVSSALLDIILVIPTIALLANNKDARHAAPL